MRSFDAAAAICPPDDRWVQIGTRLVLIRIAGPRLAERLFDPVRHIETKTPGRPLADITINAWSVAETGVPSPPGLPFEWSDSGRSLAVASFSSVEEFSRLSLARPFQNVLVPLLSIFDLRCVHGGLIAPPGSTAGLLLIGPNGSGKSTTCLSAVVSGFRLVGEDCLAIESADNGIVGHSLYCTFSLTQRSREMFGSLTGDLRFPFGAAPDAKAVLALPATGPASPMERTLPIRAVLFPEITGAGRSQDFAVSRSEAYRRLMPGLRLMRHFEAKERQQHHDALSRLVSDLPCYRVELGTRLQEIPDLLQGLARAVA